jgi:hypothetical protein
MIHRHIIYSPIKFILVQKHRLMYEAQNLLGPDDGSSTHL